MPAGAQAPPGDAASAFGGFSSAGRANGIQVTYDVENVFPLPPPLFQVSVPEALGHQRSRARPRPRSAAPPSRATCSATCPRVVEQASPGNGSFVPPYPLQARGRLPGRAA